MGRFSVLFLHVLIAGWLVSATTAPARAHSVELRSITCTAGADSIEQALSYTLDELRCSGDRFAERDRYVRTSVQLDGHTLPTGSGLVWQTEASDFASMLVRFTYDDGTRSIVDVDPQMGVRNWFAGNRFSVPVPESASQLAVVDTVIERPYTGAIAASSRIVTRQDSQQDHYLRSLCYVLVIGILIVPLIYDVLFYRILRQRYILWHLGMVGAMLAYTLLHSGLIFTLFPDMPLGLRWRAASISFIFAIAASIMVVRGLIESRLLDRKMAIALAIAAAIPVVIKVASLVGGEALRLTINPFYLLGFIPAALLLVGVLAVAMARGSRGARWALLAFAPLILAGFLRLLAGLDVLDLAFSIQDIVFGALALLAGLLSLGVGDRFLILKQDHDEARMQAIRLGQMANTDGLTGLANRRAFDMIARLAPGYGLIVSDIDRFKAINDEHGHQVGDAVLCHVASVLRSEISDRPEARIFRLGGEEFAILVRVENDDDLVHIAERLRRAIATSDPVEEEFDLPEVQISSGAVLGHGQVMHAAFADADAALYSAKNAGRNQTVLYTD